MALKTKVVINSVTVKDDSDGGDLKLITNWSYERTTDSGISELDMVALKTIEDTVSLKSGQVVEIWMGHTTSTDEKIFSGFISEHKLENGVVQILCFDKMWDLVRKNVNKVYESSGAQAGEISAIAKDLIETYGGLNSDEQATGTADGQIISEYRCDHTDIYSRLMALARAVDYQVWYDPVNDTVHFEPAGYTTSVDTLTVGSNILGLPKWTNDTSRMINDLRVDGAVSETQTRLPVGTGVGQIGTTSGFETTGITLTKTPQSVELILDSGTPPTEVKVGGSKDASTGHFYYVDLENKLITPATGTTFTNAHYAIVNYTWLAPSPIHEYDAVSIATYGKFEKQVTLTDIQNVADAEVRTRDILSKFSDPFLIGEIMVKNLSTLTYKVGDRIQIVDTVSNPNVNSQLIITKEVVKYPSSMKEIVVGDEGIRLADWQLQTEDRIKRLEENVALQNQDLLLELVDFEAPFHLENRYLWMTTRDTSTDTIWGRENWNAENWDGDYANAEVDHFIQQFEDTYTEEFIDDDFEGAGTATGWTSGSLDFTSGQIGLSLPIDYNNSTITTATLTPTITSGSFKYEMCADGSTFEQLAVPIAHYKCNDNAASTVVIDSIGNFAGVLSGGDNTSDKTTTGKINEGFSLNGTDDYVQTDFGNPTNFTYACWCKLTISEQDFNNPSGDKIQLMWTQDDNPAMGIKSSGVFTGIIKNGAEGSISATTTTTINDGDWNHYVMTFDGTNLRIYLNGLLAATSATVTGRGALADVSRFGRDDAGRFVKGVFDDVRVYDMALSQAQIQQIYNSGNGTETQFFAHTFTTTGTDLRWRATENAASTGEISQIVVSSYH